MQARTHQIIYVQELGLMDVLGRLGVTQASPTAPVEINTTTTSTHTTNNFVNVAPVVSTVNDTHQESHSSSTTVEQPKNCVVDMSNTVNTGT